MKRAIGHNSGRISIGPLPFNRIPRTIRRKWVSGRQDPTHCATKMATVSLKVRDGLPSAGRAATGRCHSMEVDIGPSRMENCRAGHPITAIDVYN